MILDERQSELSSLDESMQAAYSDISDIQSQIDAQNNKMSAILADEKKTAEERAAKTLQLAAYSFMGQYKMEWQNIMSAAILIIIPALILYLIFQKSIIKGVVAGAVKG